MDRLLKLSEAECPDDADYLLEKSSKQIAALKDAKIFNKTERYKKLKDLLQPYFAAPALMFLNFFKESTNDPIEISEAEYAQVEPMMVRLY